MIVPKALTFGPDRAVLLTDRRFAGSDTLVITCALAAAIRKVRKEHGPPTSSLPASKPSTVTPPRWDPGLRSGLGCRRLTYVGKIRALDLTVRTIQTERRAEGGVQVLLTSPYLITILEATTRFAAAPWPDALRAARAPIVNGTHRTRVSRTFPNVVSPTVIK